MSESSGQRSRKALCWTVGVLLMAVGGGAGIGAIFGVCFVFWQGNSVAFALREGGIFGGILGMFLGAASFVFPMFAVQSAGYLRTLVVPYPVAAVSAVILAPLGLPGLGAVLAIFAASCVTVAVRGQLRRKRLMHLCQSCGYDLRSLTASVCPECGNAVHSSSSMSGA